MKPLNVVMIRSMIILCGNVIFRLEQYLGAGVQVRRCLTARVRRQKRAYWETDEIGGEIFSHIPSAEPEWTHCSLYYFYEDMKSSREVRKIQYS